MSSSRLPVKSNDKNTLDLENVQAESEEEEIILEPPLPEEIPEYVKKVGLLNAEIRRAN